MRALLSYTHQAGTWSTSACLPWWECPNGFSAFQVPQWSRLGRLKRSSFPNLGGGGHTFGGGAGAGMMSAIAGRLLCDTYLGARELLREVDYTMTTLARIHLGQARSDLAASDVPGAHHTVLCSHALTWLTKPPDPH